MKAKNYRRLKEARHRSTASVPRSVWLIKDVDGRVTRDGVDMTPEEVEALRLSGATVRFWEIVDPPDFD